jgi:uncharacterized protein YoxC
MKYTQRTINMTINYMSKQFDMSDADINFYTKQLELLVEAVTFDFKESVQQIKINSKTHTHEINSNQSQATSTGSDGRIHSSSIQEEE